MFHLDPCGGGGGGGGAENPPPGGGGGVKNGAALCTIFHSGWIYDTATGYDPPKAPIIASLNGTADFNATCSTTRSAASSIASRAPIPRTAASFTSPT